MKKFFSLLALILSCCAPSSMSISVPTIPIEPLQEPILEQSSNVLFGTQWFMILPKNWTIDNKIVRTKNTELVTTSNEGLTLMIESKQVGLKNFEADVFIQEQIEEYARLNCLDIYGVSMFSLKDTPGSIAVFKQDNMKVIQMILFLGDIGIIVTCGGETKNDELVIHRCVEAFKSLSIIKKDVNI